MGEIPQSECDDNHGSLAAAAERASAARAQRQHIDKRNSKFQKATNASFDKERIRLIEAEEKAKAQVAGLEAECDRCLNEAEALRRQNSELKSSYAERITQLSRELRLGGITISNTEDVRPGTLEPLGMSRETVCTSPTLAEPDASLPFQERFQRQRELLVRVLRRSAVLEEEILTLRDDLTRKDVVIHNLRQDKETQQQQTQQQYNQFQQQDQLQQLQMLQQLQELQRLLQAQQQQLHHQQQEQMQPDPSPEHVVEPLGMPVRGEGMKGDAQELCGGELVQQVVRPSLEEAENGVSTNRTLQHLLEEIRVRDNEVDSLKSLLRSAHADVSNHLATNNGGHEPHPVIQDQLVAPEDQYPLERAVDNAELVWPGRTK